MPSGLPRRRAAAGRPAPRRRPSAQAALPPVAARLRGPAAEQGPPRPPAKLATPPCRANLSPPQDKDRFRLDLLTMFPPLRNFLRSPLWPNALNERVTPLAYAAILAVLFFGPQDREHNFALNLFWCWWWPGVFVLYAVAGRWWCSGELAHGPCVGAAARNSAGSSDAARRDAAGAVQPRCAARRRRSSHRALQCAPS